MQSQPKKDDSGTAGLYARAFKIRELNVQLDEIRSKRNLTAATKKKKF